VNGLVAGVISYSSTGGHPTGVHHDDLPWNFITTPHGSCQSFFFQSIFRGTLLPWALGGLRLSCWNFGSQLKFYNGKFVVFPSFSLAGE
jgi:hypothetical protein